MKMKTKIKHKGGQKLGEGSFGCVITPPVNCGKYNKYNNNNYVSKLITINNKYDKEDIDKEYEINNRIRRLDPDMNYFTTILDNCTLKRATKRKDIKFVHSKKKEDMNKCLVKKNKKTINLIMKNGGLNLDDILIYKKYDYARLLIHKNFKMIVYNLILGINKLHNNHIVHHDIKPDNFAVKIDDFKINLTYLDFGMSEYKKDSDKSIKYLSRSVYGTPGYISTDMYILSTIIKYLDGYSIENFTNEKFKKYLIRNVFNTVKQYEISYQKSIGLNKVNLSYSDEELKYSKHLHNNYNLINKNELSRLYNIFINLIITNKIETYLYKKKDGVFYKYDIYALGITIFRLSTIIGIKDKNLYNLIRNMIQFIPHKRFNSEECVNHPYFKNINLSKQELNEKVVNSQKRVTKRQTKPKSNQNNKSKRNSKPKSKRNSKPKKK